jgi:hypothetical protein
MKEALLCQQNFATRLGSSHVSSPIEAMGFLIFLIHLFLPSTNTCAHPARVRAAKKDTFPYKGELFL